MSEKKKAREVNWKVSIALYVVGSVLFGAVLSKAADVRTQQSAEQNSPPPQVAPRTGQISPRHQLALKSIGHVETLALYIAGTKTGEQCAVPAVQMTHAFVQASINAGGWKGLAKLRKTYEKTCVAICEQETKTACYSAIIKGIGDWKDWIKAR